MGLGLSHLVIVGGSRDIVLKVTRAENLIRDLPGMDPEGQQLALARATGNFKRGNERQAR